ncbi:MAG: copper transporter [Coriobacteriia bacterium]|nr:copper transporter [Coriobacteriia bacterium]
MYNLRYHIASLVALFLALALGLILGGLVVQSGAVSRQQNALVKGLEKQFAELREENSGLSADNEVLDAFGSTLTDEWVRGRLEGKTVIVVTNGGRASGGEAALEAVEGAGGAVAGVVLLQPDLGLEDVDVRSQVESLVSSDGELLESVVTSLVAEWASAETTRPVTAALVEAGALRIDGFTDGMDVVGLLDLAMTQGKVEPAGIALATAFQEFGVGVAAQVEGEDPGITQAADDAGISAFDTLGNDVGSYTLVALFTGSKPGIYGTGEGANAAFPDPPEITP